MGAQLSVQVEGLRELVRDLERAGVDLDDLKDAIGRISAEGAETAQGHTPRRSGKLAGTVRGNRAKNKAQVTIGTARVPYAGPIIFGWPKRGIRPAHTIDRTDAVMVHRAPQILDDELGRIFAKYGFQ